VLDEPATLGAPALSEGLLLPRMGTLELPAVCPGVSMEFEVSSASGWLS
jgi:hypothetical protein